MSDASFNETTLDTRRHRGIFDPYEFCSQGNSATVIGAGMTGGRICRHLAELGAPLSVYDANAVDGSEVLFPGESIGQARAEMLRKVLLRDTGQSIESHARLPESDEQLGNVIFVCSASREIRKTLCHQLRIGALKADLLVDVREDHCHAELLLLKPRWPRELRQYRRSLSGPIRECRLPVWGDYVASCAVFQAIHWFENEHSYREGKVPEELLPQRQQLSFRCSDAAAEKLYDFPQLLGKQPYSISLVGAGALGSRVGRSLASLGLSFEVFDYDSVEPQNIPNQAYGLGEIGSTKATALAQLCKRDFGVDVNARVEQFDGSQPLGEIVFVCPDNMACRQTVWDCVRLKSNAVLLLEGRMGDVWGKAYAVSPRNPIHIEPYEETLHGDEVAFEAGPGVCRETTSVGPTAEGIASRMVGQFLRWLASTAEERKQLDHELLEYFRPYFTAPRNFS